MFQTVQRRHVNGWVLGLAQKTDSDSSPIPPLIFRDTNSGLNFRPQSPLKRSDFEWPQHIAHLRHASGKEMIILNIELENSHLSYNITGGGGGGRGQKAKSAKFGLWGCETEQRIWHCIKQTLMAFSNGCTSVDHFENFPGKNSTKIVQSSISQLWSLWIVRFLLILGISMCYCFPGATES